MSTILIPTQTDGTPWYDFGVELDGTSYTLEFKWNPIEGQWYMSIYDSKDALLLAERRLSVGIPLTKQFRITGLPPGEFFVVDTSGQGVEAGLTELGSRVQLLYQEQATLPASFKQP